VRSRNPPPSASACRCARTRTLNLSESQNRVPVMSTTMAACPWAAECSRTVRSYPAVIMSISAGAVTTAMPLIITGNLTPGTCSHLQRRTRIESGDWAGLHGMGEAGSFGARPAGFSTVRRCYWP